MNKLEIPHVGILNESGFYEIGVKGVDNYPNKEK